MIIYYVTIGILIIAYSSAIITALVTINGKLDRLLDKTECLLADKPQEKWIDEDDNRYICKECEYAHKPQKEPCEG